MLDDHEIQKRFHSVLDSIEQLVQGKELNADLRKIYALIEMVAERRPVSFDFVQIDIINSQFYSCRNPQ